MTFTILPCFTGFFWEQEVNSVRGELVLPLPQQRTEEALYCLSPHTLHCAFSIFLAQFLQAARTGRGLGSASTPRACHTCVRWLFH